MENTPEENRSITQPASKVMLGGILALAGGLASNIIVAALFGAGTAMDAYLTAIVIPSYMQIVFFSSLSFVFVPAFIETETNDGEKEAWRLVGTFFWLTSAILFVITVAVSFFSTQIIDLIAPGFEPGKAALASKMLSVLIFSIPFTGLSTFTLGIQNARNKFFWPSVAPAFGSFTNVIVLMIFSKTDGAMALCWGFLASCVMQAAITVVPILSHGWSKGLKLNDQRVVQIGKLTVPLILFGMVTSFSSIAERYFSSVLPDGQIAYIGYASKISSIFVIMLASGIAAAIFPSMARTFARDGIAGLAEKNDFGLRLTFALALPTILISGAVAIPLVRVFFERGAFSSIDTLGVSQIIFIFLIGDVFFRMVGNILQRSFYVLKNTHTQPIVSIILLALFMLTARFIVDRWGYFGLVMASVGRNGIGTLIIWVLLARKFPTTNLRNMLAYFLKYSFAALAAYIVARATLSTLGSAPALLQLLMGTSFSTTLYLLMIYFLDREMLTMLFDLIGARYVFEKLHNRKQLAVSKETVRHGKGIDS